VTWHCSLLSFLPREIFLNSFTLFFPATILLWWKKRCPFYNNASSKYFFSKNCLRQNGLQKNSSEKKWLEWNCFGSEFSSFWNRIVWKKIYFVKHLSWKHFIEMSCSKKNWKNYCSAEFLVRNQGRIVCGKIYGAKTVNNSSFP
jgi:hypothetical protein